MLRMVPLLVLVGHSPSSQLHFQVAANLQPLTMDGRSGMILPLVQQLAGLASNPQPSTPVLLLHGTWKLPGHVTPKRNSMLTGLPGSPLISRSRRAGAGSLPQLLPSSSAGRQSSHTGLCCPHSRLQGCHLEAGRIRGMLPLHSSSLAWHSGGQGPQWWTPGSSLTPGRLLPCAHRLPLPPWDGTACPTCSGKAGRGCVGPRPQLLPGVGGRLQALLQIPHSCRDGSSSLALRRQLLAAGGMQRALHKARATLWTGCISRLGMGTHCHPQNGPILGLLQAVVICSPNSQAAASLCCAVAMLTPAKHHTRAGSKPVPCRLLLLLTATGARLGSKLRRRRHRSLPCANRQRTLDIYKVCPLVTPASAIKCWEGFVLNVISLQHESTESHLATGRCLCTMQDSSLFS